LELVNLAYSMTADNINLNNVKYEINGVSISYRTAFVSSVEPYLTLPYLLYGVGIYL
jgi:hypothetical protein